MTAQRRLPTFATLAATGAVIGGLLGLIFGLWLIVPGEIGEAISSDKGNVSLVIFAAVLGLVFGLLIGAASALAAGAVERLVLRVRLSSKVGFGCGILAGVVLAFVGSYFAMSLFLVHYALLAVAVVALGGGIFALAQWRWRRTHTSAAG